MSITIKAPMFPESVSEGTVATWYKKPGESVARDELLVDIETDKVVLEVVAPIDGVLQNVSKKEGDIISSEEVLAVIDTDAKANSSATQSADTPVEASANSALNLIEQLSPAVRKLVQEHNIALEKVSGSGKGGRITKADVLAFLEAKNVQEKLTESTEIVEKTAAPVTKSQTVSPVVLNELPEIGTDKRVEKRVPMTRLRARIAERLVQAQQTAAMLTTFNEVDMKPIMTLRKRYRDEFEKTHNVRLGFMSFFVRASTEALKRFPAVNSSIDGSEIVYHGYYDIGVAVSSERGLVVPILRDVDQKSLAEIESNIVTYSEKAKENKLAIDDIQGGTFTISNGGVFGSLMSTPILNPPQSAILGMHKIQERPVVVNGEIVILPMMYLALSYDHRLIDGREAVQFLVAIKELIEDPMKLLLDI